MYGSGVTGESLGRGGGSPPSQVSPHLSLSLHSAKVGSEDFISIDRFTFIKI